nr:hypothetical protein [Mycoplasmopsis bovis]
MLKHLTQIKTRIQNPTQNLNAENQDSRNQTHESNSENEDSKPNSESKCRKSRFKKQTHNLNHVINQDSETNVSSNELTKPGEKHTKWYANRKIWNKRLFR